jgi:heavy metal translocating P-type ATPase
MSSTEARRTSHIRDLTVPALTLISLACGGVAWLLSSPVDANWILMSGLVLTGTPVVWNTVRHALRGHFATDIVATLAIIGAVLIAQPIAGLVVVLMQTGGEALERYAAGRASAALRQLEEAAPRVAHRVMADGSVHEKRVDDIVVGDVLLVRPGDVVPCDCEVTSGQSHLDTARITGEPVPWRAAPGSRIPSGVQNLEGALTVRALALAAQSQYAQIVALVRSAQGSKAPLQRVADRYAVWFTPLTLAICTVTWILTRNADHVLAILTVATPCPLILATPVAIIGGISQAARRHVIIRDGAALEALASVDAIVLDKTGTLTTGLPAVMGIVSLGAHTETELITLAASLEQATSHVVGQAIVDAAEARGLDLDTPEEVTETPGEGLTGRVRRHRVTIGGWKFVEMRHGITARPPTDGPHTGRLVAWLVVDDVLAGYIALDERVRSEIRPVLAELQSLGVNRVALLSGDDEAHTRTIAAEAGITESSGALFPADKARYIGQMQRAGLRVLMVGDGTNDAPALTVADVGISMASGGGGIAAEAADGVVLSGSLQAVADSVRIGQRTLTIARQSIRVGLGLSVVAMGFAAAGMIAPVAGALLQEAIDIAVILNALRAATSARPVPALPVPTPALSVMLR